MYLCKPKGFLTLELSDMGVQNWNAWRWRRKWRLFEMHWINSKKDSNVSRVIFVDILKVFWSTFETPLCCQTDNRYNDWIYSLIHRKKRSWISICLRRTCGLEEGRRTRCDALQILSHCDVNPRFLKTHTSAVLTDREQASWHSSRVIGLCLLRWQQPQ